MKGVRIFVLLLTAVGIITVFPSTAHATFPGKNGRIAFARLDFTGRSLGLYTANPDGTDQRLLTGLPSSFSDWAPDGKRIAFDFFDSEGNEQIGTINSDGTDFKQITSGPGIHEAPTWSPDGSQIVFDYSPLLPVGPGFFTSIYVMNSDGSNPRLVTTTTDTFDVEPKFSPDGKQILFVRIRRDITTVDGLQFQAILVMNSDGSLVRQLTPWGVAEHPNWSPDNKWITFDENTFFPNQEHPTIISSIFKVHPDGSNLEVVFNGENFKAVRNPAFSPDGNELIFSHALDIWTLNIRTLKLTNVTKTGDFIETLGSWGIASDGPAKN